MGFTNPFTGIERRTLTDEELARAIRIDMAAELDAINLYQAHIDATDNEVAKRIIRHIMDEEKDHLQEFAQLLYHLDPRQAEAVEHAREELAELGAGQAASNATHAPEEPTSSSSVSPFTIGSLKDES